MTVKGKGGHHEAAGVMDLAGDPRGVGPVHRSVLMGIHNEEKDRVDWEICPVCRCEVMNPKPIFVPGEEFEIRTADGSIVILDRTADEIKGFLLECGCMVESIGWARDSAEVERVRRDLAGE